eukprot:175195-Amphidinium_carterae.1
MSAATTHASLKAPLQTKKTQTLPSTRHRHQMLLLWWCTVRVTSTLDDESSRDRTPNSSLKKKVSPWRNAEQMTQTSPPKPDSAHQRLQQ